MPDEKLPTPPILTPDQLAINAAEQEMRSRRFKDSISPGNIKFARAAAVIRETEIILDNVKSIAKKKSLLTPHQITRYAKALATIGDFKEAAKFDDTQDYKELDRAIWRPDSDSCKCRPIKRLEQDETVTTFDNMFVAKKVFSIKHNREVDLMICNHCSFKNAR